jgi:hypothetical protein
MPTLPLGLLKRYVLGGWKLQLTICRDFIKKAETDDKAKH